MDISGEDTICIRSLVLAVLPTWPPQGIGWCYSSCTQRSELFFQMLRNVVMRLAGRMEWYFFGFTDWNRPDGEGSCVVKGTGYLQRMPNHKKCPDSGDCLSETFRTPSVQCSSWSCSCFALSRGESRLDLFFYCAKLLFDIHRAIQTRRYQSHLSLADNCIHYRRSIHDVAGALLLYVLPRSLMGYYF